MMRNLNPRRVIILGGVLAIVGVVLNLVVPAILAEVVSLQVSLGGGLYEQTSVGNQDVLVLGYTILGVVQQVLVPFGAALVGAGLVMRYIDERARLAITEPLDQSDVEA